MNTTTGNAAHDAAVTAQEQTRGAWNEIAPGYDEFVTPTHLWLGTEALVRAGVRSGMQVLDVACGSGALSIPAARMGAQVLATDLSPAMIRQLEARAQAEGLVHLQARVMDGHSLDLESDTFDIAGSQFGVMLFPDLPRALGELARVTRPGGRVLMVVFGPPAHVEFLDFFLGAIRAVVPGFAGLPADPPPLPFQVAEPEKLQRALAAVGLTDIRVEPIVERLELHSGTHMWQWLTNSNPIARMLIADLTAEQKNDVRLVLDGMLRERSGGAGPAILTSLVYIGIGTK